MSFHAIICHLRFYIIRMNPHLQIVTLHPPSLVSTPLLTSDEGQLQSFAHICQKKLKKFLYISMLDCSTHPICCNPTGNLQQHHQNIRYPGVLLQMPRFQNESIDIKIFGRLCHFHFFKKTPSSLLMRTRNVDAISIA